MTLAEIKKSLKTKGIGIVAAKADKIIGSKDHNDLPDDYAWHNGGLYHRGGDTLLPHHSGNWVWLENCDESEAAERAAEWEAQK